MSSSNPEAKPEKNIQDAKLTIVYIITKLELGGAQQVCLTLFNHLKNSYNTFCISGNDGVLVNQVINNNTVILLPSFKRELYWTSLWQEVKTFITLVKELKKLKHQYPNLIVHTHSTKAGILGRFAAFFARIPDRVHTVHGFAFHSHQNIIPWFCIMIIEWVTALITTRFICVSTADIATGTRFLPRFKKKCTLIRAAVAHPALAEIIKTTRRVPQNEPFRFGTIACFKPQKNLFDLLHAFALVHNNHKNCELHIIGDGILLPKIEAWITQHQLDKVVFLHGWQQDILPFVANWHAFVLTSLWEGLPCSVVEARLSKLPVISYATGGITDVIYHGLNGFVYPPKDFRGIAQGMLTLIHDETLYARMSNYKENLASFMPQAMVAQHAYLYEQMQIPKI
jgi:glycosyltransferase involved in cell wall biosynthesis